MDDSDDIIVNAAKTYFLYRFLWACFALGFGILGGIYLIIWWAYEEVSREMSYHRRYGTNWQIEYEKYNGTLAHAHAQLAICVCSLLAVIAVMSWFCHQTFHRHQRHMHEHRMRMEQQD